MEPDKARGRIGLDQDQQATARDQGASRSYECVFCKRGFTNAQALGGHMNIHRKEKARMKQSSSNFDEPQPAMEVSKMPSSYSPIPLSDFLPLEPKNPNSSWISETALVEDGLKLPLFTETPASSDRQTARPAESPAGPEIDLELRLGPERKDSTAGNTSTRHFF